MIGQNDRKILSIMFIFVKTIVVFTIILNVSFYLTS